MKVKGACLTLVGRPNAGKSSLLNHIVGEKIAIVTPKAQTTRTLLRGYLKTPSFELIITDTPGLQDGTRELNQALSRSATVALDTAREGGEAIAFVLDARSLRENPEIAVKEEFANLVRSLTLHKTRLPLDLPLFVLLNKSDQAKQPETRSQIESCVRQELSKISGGKSSLSWVSARSGEGIPAFLAELEAQAPELASGELFDIDALSDKSLREITSELIREQCFLQLGQELPYSIAIELERFDEKDPALTRIEAIIHVERESQKPIVIGEGGAKIKAIGTSAREAIEKLIDKKVFLGLRVKVSPHWTKNASQVERFGYGPPQ